MRNGTLRRVSLVLAVLSLSIATTHAGVTISFGTEGFYLSVGDYDYLPYAYSPSPYYPTPRISMHDVMSQYGTWLPVECFGMVWKPYVSYGWRPYMYGHWINTQYGPTWEGYEPWAWIGYHYGDWILSKQHGWVWMPGYEWHPGHVVWARSYGSVGWMPAPPPGFDYSRGYLSYVGQFNQYSYDDPQFLSDFGTGYYNYGGPYYDPRYRDMYYNPSYSSININLWIFIDNRNFAADNYANYAFGSDYARHVFDRKLVRITSRQIGQYDLERLVGQRIPETAVDIRELQADKGSIKVVVPRGSEVLERIRKNSGEMVREVIAPGFAEKQISFKGQNSVRKTEIDRMFQQERVVPRVQTLSSDQVISQARVATENRKQVRVVREKEETEKLVKIEKEGKVKPAKEPDEAPKDQKRLESNEPRLQQEPVNRSVAEKPIDRQDVATQPRTSKPPAEEPRKVVQAPPEDNQNLKQKELDKTPKSDVKTDVKETKKEQDVSIAVKAILGANRSIDSSNISVETNAAKKTVTLKGTVPSTAQRSAAEKVARETALGYQIVNQLTVPTR